MKGGLKHIVGKQITGVLVAASERSPHEQVFLVFADGSDFEFWGDDFNCGAGLDRADGIERYVRSGKGEVVRVYGAPLGPARSARPPLTPGTEKTPDQGGAPGTLAELMTRDLDAWRQAKAVIAKARK
jgi:hypothetical protein